MKRYPKIFPVGHLGPKILALFKMRKPIRWATSALTGFVVEAAASRLHNLGYLIMKMAKKWNKLIGHQGNHIHFEWLEAGLRIDMNGPR